MNFFRTQEFGGGDAPSAPPPLSDASANGIGVTNDKMGYALKNRNASQTLPSVFSGFPQYLVGSSRAERLPQYLSQRKGGSKAPARPVYRIQRRGGGQGPIFDDGGGKASKFQNFPKIIRDCVKIGELRFRGGGMAPCPPPVYGPGTC